MRYFKKLILQLATLHRVFFLKIKEKTTIFFIMSTLLPICVRYNNKHARTNTKLFLNIIQKEKKRSDKVNHLLNDCNNNNTIKIILNVRCPDE